MWNEKWTIERDWNHSLILNTFQFTINSLIFQDHKQERINSETPPQLLNFTYLNKFHLRKNEMKQRSLL